MNIPFKHQPPLKRFYLQITDKSVYLVEHSDGAYCKWYQVKRLVDELQRIEASQYHRPTAWCIIKQDIYWLYNRIRWSIKNRL